MPTRPYRLPAITAEGRNTFGCTINGEVMVAIDQCANPFCFPNPNFDPTMGMVVGGRMDTVRNQPRSGVILNLYDINEVGRYRLDTFDFVTERFNVRNMLRVQRYVAPAFYVTTMDSGSFARGEINVTRYDLVAAGTFWFDLYDPSRWPDTIRVRDGRFDIRCACR